MVVKHNNQFRSLLGKVEGHVLVNAHVIKHDDNSGNYEEIVLEFQNGSATSKISFTSNWEPRKADREIIDTTIDTAIEEVISTKLLK
ncbi:hypothetical protein [Bacillus phage CP-51]|uniref:Uncharacterized protein n=1 Tax=Bacillus phage CP-51 TaxID=1391188 RepID=A0A068EQD9_9CAUD|nr:hypothetical protein OZ73_gp142 [Bacillus phage CP-51]AID50577.1 hypothetical protein [Bacillus phage CP-51]